MSEESLRAYLAEAWTFALSYSWIAIAAFFSWGVVRVLKSDTKIPWDVPPRWRPPLAIAFGVIASTLEKIAAGGNWKMLLPHGLVVGAGAILVHVFGVDVLRGGKDVPLPKALSLPPPPPPGGAGDSPSIPPAPRPPSGTLLQSGIRSARRGMVSVAFAAVLALGVSGCALLKPRVIHALFDLGCVILHSELPDAVIDRVCAVPPEAQEEAHKAAAVAREQSRAFASGAAAGQDAGAP